MVKNDEAKYQDEMMTDLKELNPIVFDHASIKYISLLRPHVFDFISELSEYKVAILTAGKKEFQQNIAVKQNLPIHEIYGKFEYNQIPKSKNCILVDDLDINTVGVNSKLKAMGIESPEDSSASNHHVKVNPWFGNKIDNGLLDSIEEIKNKIAIVGRQSWANTCIQMFIFKNDLRTSLNPEHSLFKSLWGTTWINADANYQKR